jgi:hypothetical protein
MAKTTRANTGTRKTAKERTVRLLIVCLLCVTSPSLAYAGPLRNLAPRRFAEQTGPAPSKSGNGLRRAGVILMVVGGGLAIVGSLQTKTDPNPFCGTAILSDCQLSDPNRTVQAVGASVAAGGLVMLVVGVSKSHPQVIAGPRRVAVQHTVKF